MRSVRKTNFDLFSRRMLALTEQLVSDFPMLSAGVIYRTVEAARCLTPRDGRHDERVLAIIEERAREDLAALQDSATLKSATIMQ